MKKLFLAVSSMIVTGFLMKSYRKLREKPETKEEVYRRIKEKVYRRMKAAHEVHSDIERRCADARATFNRMASISTPMDGGLIDSLMQMSRGGSHD